MDKKDFSFSLMFVPHKGARVRTLKLSHRNVVLAMVLTGAFCLALLGSVARFAYVNQKLALQQQELDQMSTLVVENQEQKQKINVLNTEAEKMRQKMDSLNSLALRISSVLKIKPQEVSRGGGPEGQTSFGELSKQADQQEQVLKSYLASAANYAEYLSHRPSIMPKHGSISSPYGYRDNPTGRGSEFHDGIDIEADYGDPVAATADGVVVNAGWEPGWGLRIDIDHGYGMKTFYAHNSKLKVKVGQEVKRGDIISLAGSTGRSTGVHVHWGATLYGQSTNPLNFLNDNR
ncbi:MAG TPA: M23 family metallopeptidase [Verrucomicrobiae bacterium]|nr:M23 family metallopeptidase [Verrucomicrobiae bacterium]